MLKSKNHVKKYRRLLVGLVCLVLLLLMSSILLGLALNGSGGQTTRQTGQNRTATSSVTPTPSMTATSSVTPSPTPLFFDDFTSKELKKDWTLSPKNNTSPYSRTMENNQLVLKDTNHQILVESLPTNSTYSDFTLTVTYTWLNGDDNDSVGLYMRGDTNLDHDYRIDIFGNNTFYVRKELLNDDKTPQLEALSDRFQSSLFNVRGQPNTLTVMMRGPFLSFAINSTIVATIEDWDYDHGQIALFVQNGATSDGVAAAFSSVKVDAPPEQIPGFPLYPTPTVTPTETATSKP